MWSSDPQPCEGCQKRSLLRVTMEVAPGVKRHICTDGTRSGDHPKGSCFDKARAAYHGCDGCGKKMTKEQWRYTALCGECRQILERAREAPPSPMVWGKISDPHRILGEYVGMERVDLSEHLPHLLAAALGDRTARTVDVGDKVAQLNGSQEDGFRNPLAGLYVELPEARVPHVREFLQTLARVGAELIAYGRERGHSVLMQLARGEMTIADYEETRRQGR